MSAQQVDMPPNNNDHQSADHSQLIEQVNKYVSVLTKFSVIAYAAGFVIVNSYYMQYGFMMYELTSPKYLTAGIVFAIFILFGTLSFYCVKAHELKADDRNIYKFWVLFLSFCYIFLPIQMVFKLSFVRSNIPYLRQSKLEFCLEFFCNFCAFLFIFILPHWQTKNVRLEKIVTIGWVLIVIEQILCWFNNDIGWVLLLLGFAFAVYLEINKFKERNSKSKDFGLVFSVALVLVWSLFSLNIFGTKIYPEITGTRGGGEPLKAALIVDVNNKSIQNLQKKYQLNFDDVLILNETQDSIFIIPDSKFRENMNALEIEKSNLIGINYFNNRGQGPI